MNPVSLVTRVKIMSKLVAPLSLLVLVLLSVRQVGGTQENKLVCQLIGNHLCLLHVLDDDVVLAEGDGGDGLLVELAQVVIDDEALSKISELEKKLGVVLVAVQ